MNLKNKKDSVTINNINKIILKLGLSHKKYSIPKVIIKYNTPNKVNKIAPLTSSFV